MIEEDVKCFQDIKCFENIKSYEDVEKFEDIKCFEDVISFKIKSEPVDYEEDDYDSDDEPLTQKLTNDRYLERHYGIRKQLVVKLEKLEYANEDPLIQSLTDDISIEKQYGIQKQLVVKLEKLEDDYDSDDEHLAPSFTDDILLERHGIRKQLVVKLEKLGTLIREDQLSGVADEEVDDIINNTNSETFLCDQCSYNTSCKSDLIQHVRTHLYTVINDSELGLNGDKSSGYTKTYACNHCNYKTHQKNKLNQLITGAHEKVKLYICKQCGYKTHLRNILKQYIAGVHAKIKLYTGIPRTYVDPQLCDF